MLNPTPRFEKLRAAATVIGVLAMVGGLAVALVAFGSAQADQRALLLAAGGLMILAGFAVVAGSSLLIKIESCDDDKPYDYQEYQRVEDMVSDLAGNNTDILLTKKDLDELVLILKGDDKEQLWQEGQFWAELIQEERASDAVCHLIIEMGSPQERLSDIHRSFAQALVKAKNLTRSSLCGLRSCCVAWSRMVIAVDPGSKWT